MKSYHITKRGNRFNFVCRIPVDLLEHFSVKTLYRSLKTDDIKHARLLAASYEYETQRVFMRLRTGMLETFEVQILVERLTKGINKIDSLAYGRKQSPMLQVIEQHNINQHMETHGCNEREAKRMIAQGYADFSGVLGESLVENNTALTMNDVESVDKILRKEYRVMLNDGEKRVLALKFLNMDKELMQAEADVRSGDFDRLERLKDRQNRNNQEVNKRYFLKDIIKGYLKSYDNPDKKDIKLNSWRAVKRHTDFIVNILGNIEFQELNSKATADKLRLALNKKKKSTGELISSKEHGSYVKRLKSIINFAMTEYEIETINKIKVDNSLNEADRRLSFDYKDMKQLEEALCTAPMVFGAKRIPRYDRFWIILIAVLHGFRKTSIVNLRERHIRPDEQTGIFCFDLTKDSELLLTKSDNMRALIPIHPLLHQIGFVEWLIKNKTNDNTKLFADSPDTFGSWFNGLNKVSGWNYEYITKDDKKTFHSFRHYFTCCMDELEVSEKQKNEMSGHAGTARGRDVRSKFYLERTRVKSMDTTFYKSIEPGRILMEDLNWQRLAERAKELFGI